MGTRNPPKQQALRKENRRCFRVSQSLQRFESSDPNTKPKDGLDCESICRHSSVHVNDWPATQVQLENACQSLRPYELFCIFLSSLFSFAVAGRRLPSIAAWCSGS
ncbi:hypothetical protein BHE74_00046158 [Ensete ventricosum]|nr:hypothetical protein BHE74_00046158 [Ensete ventricosum]